MGIKDEDYREALIQKHMKAHLDYYRKAKEEDKMSGTGTVLISQGGTTTTFTGNGNYSTTANPYVANPTTGTFIPAGVKPIAEKDLHHDAMKAPLSALVDMWVVRWQDEWVNETEFQEDDFWRLALIRLMGANKLEKHNLANQYYSVYRIIE